jgi:hypothetical protein
MRRTLMLLALGACLAAAAVLPAVALAHHGHDRTIRGTVESFDNGMLAIKKASGKIVTAKVTRRTEIECENENEINDSRARASDHGGDDNGGGDDRGDDNRDNEVEHENEVEDQNQVQNENEDKTANCDSTQLKAGTVVSRARLRDRGDRDFWKNLKLEL